MRFPLFFINVLIETTRKNVVGALIINETRSSGGGVVIGGISNTSSFLRCM